MIFRWTGNADTNFNNGANWQDQNGNVYATGTYPGSLSGRHDDVYFDSALSAIAHSAAGADLALTSNTSFNTFNVTSAYNGTIGSAGTPLVILASAVQIGASSAGSIYLSGANAATASVFNITDGSAITLSGYLSDVTLMKGSLTITDGTTIYGRLTIGFATSQSSDSNLTLGQIAGQGPQQPVTQYGGTVQSTSQVQYLNIYGGTWFQNAPQAENVILDGGTLIWNQGDITQAMIYAGSLNASQSTLPRTLNACWIYPTGSINLDNGVGNVEIGWINVQASNGNPNINFPASFCFKRATVSQYDSSSNEYIGADNLDGLQIQAIPGANGASVYTSDVTVMPTDAVCAWVLWENNDEAFEVNPLWSADHTHAGEVSGNGAITVLATQASGAVRMAIPVNSSLPNLRLQVLVQTGSATPGNIAVIIEKDSRFTPATPTGFSF